MKNFALAFIVFSFSLPALADPAASNNLGQQNAVANQQSVSELGLQDSVTQANVKVLGDAPAVAMGNLFISTSQALSNAAHNATNNQQQSYVTMQASTTQGVATMLSADPASLRQQTGIAKFNE